MSLTFKVADSGPSALGVNVTLMVHEAPAAKLAGSVPHVFVCEKSPALWPVNPMLRMLKAVNSLFCRVNFPPLLPVLMATPPKPTEGGVSVAGARPVPDKVTFCGVFAALSLTLSVALSAPTMLGVKVTLIVHFAPGARLAGQWLVGAKSAAFVPVNVTLGLDMIRFPVPVLVRVIFFAALGVLKTSFPNDREVGESVAAALAPVPVSPMLWGVPAALSATVTAPVRVPASAGVKVTSMVQVAAEGKVSPL